jgi:hypothetical protein
MQKILSVGLLLLCSNGIAFAQDATSAANATREAIQAAQATIPLERTELHGVRAELKAGIISKQAAQELVTQIRAEIRALRHH